jgi:hypothetical protein
MLGLHIGQNKYEKNLNRAFYDNQLTVGEGFTQLQLGIQKKVALGFPRDNPQSDRRAAAVAEYIAVAVGTGDFQTSRTDRSLEEVL